MQFNTSYLNLTPNKTPRNTKTFKPEFVVMHETAGYGSLQWNLRADVRSSYNYLISRAGVVYHYVDERAFIAWHAGVNSMARGYSGGQINVFGIGCELEGPNDGTPITTAQTKAMLELMRHFRDAYGIPITRQFYFAHKDVAPGHKTDPQGYSVEQTIKLISESEPDADPRPDSLGAQLRNEVYKLAGGEYRPDWLFHQFAREHKLGSPIRVGMDFTTKGQRYTGEVYGRDVLVSRYNQWNIVLRAADIRDDQLYDDLMRFTYGVLGVDYRPEQAFAHAVRRAPVGVPLEDSRRIDAPGGASYAIQIFAFDALYTPIAGAGAATDWSVVRQLSELIAGRRLGPVEAALRDAIFAALYRRINDRYVADRPFIRRALELALGAPLTLPREWSYKGVAYDYVVYAGDTLYAPKSGGAPKLLSQTPD